MTLKVVLWLPYAFEQIAQIPTHMNICIHIQIHPHTHEHTHIHVYPHTPLYIGTITHELSDVTSTWSCVCLREQSADWVNVGVLIVARLLLTVAL